MSALSGFPTPTVPGHRGTLRLVDVGDTPVLILAGRSHLYEGYPVAGVVHGVRTAVMAGCEVVMLTNAAGSLRPEVGVGRLVTISDQLNLTGANPLCGDEPPRPHPGRFVDLTDLYSRRLRDVARATTVEAPQGGEPIGIVEGVYAGVLGGTFETPAEIRMLASVGADLVGMSTVLEAIAARHLGAEVFGLSLVTNLAAGLQDDLDHLEVLAAGDAALDSLVDVLRPIIDAC